MWRTNCRRHVVQISDFHTLVYRPAYSHTNMYTGINTHQIKSKKSGRNRGRKRRAEGCKEEQKSKVIK